MKRLLTPLSSGQTEREESPQSVAFNLKHVLGDLPLSVIMPTGGWRNIVSVPEPFVSFH